MTLREKRPYPVPGFGERLREAREAAGLTQGQLGAHIGTRKGVISLWERELNFPKDESLIAVCGIVGIEPPLPDRNEKGRRAQGKSACPVCGKEFAIFYGEQYCSRKCAYQGLTGKHRTDNSYVWKGGRSVSPDGYVFIHKPDHPHADKIGYVREHRWIMEQHLGRILDRRERVHHKNGNRSDNRVENLEMWTLDHDKTHTPGTRQVDHIVHLMSQLSEEDRREVLDRFR